eukprot:329107-Chlamydomonas_euryale.AAC.15
MSCRQVCICCTPTVPTRIGLQGAAMISNLSTFTAQKHRSCKFRPLAQEIAKSAGIRAMPTFKAYFNGVCGKMAHSCCACRSIHVEHLIPNGPACATGSCCVCKLQPMPSPTHQHGTSSISLGNFRQPHSLATVCTLSKLVLPDTLLEIGPCCAFPGNGCSQVDELVGADQARLRTMIEGYATHVAKVANRATPTGTGRKLGGDDVAASGATSATAPDSAGDRRRKMAEAAEARMKASVGN